ncbi:hypothetical protein PV646_28505 [Streptomyces sp. ID05-26A]|nr:hypothetical protein [Streptomyces sp. ID05-26A]
MADVSIPREAVDKAARALVESNTLTYKTWDEMNEGQHRLWRQRAEVVLNASAPLVVAAAYDRAKSELDRLSNMVDAIGDDDYESDDNDGECPCGGNCHTAEAVATYARVGSVLTHWAVELRAQS